MVHMLVALDSASRFLLPLLDGSRAHPALLQALEHVDEPSVDGATAGKTASPDALLADVLGRLLRSALLVG